jgi:hypothetical protein
MGRTLRRIGKRERNEIVPVFGIRSIQTNIVATGQPAYINGAVGSGGLVPRFRTLLSWQIPRFPEGEPPVASVSVTIKEEAFRSQSRVRVVSGGTLSRPQKNPTAKEVDLRVRLLRTERAL